MIDHADHNSTGTATTAAHRRTRRRAAMVLSVAAVLAATAGATTAGAALASTSPAASSGVVHIYEDSLGGKINPVVITGYLNDHGMDHEDVLDHGQVNKIVLSKGSFEANVAKLHANLEVVASYPKGCTLILKSTAPVTLSNGSGAYKGIQGTLTITSQDVVVFPREKNGSCNEQLSLALTDLTTVSGSGKVSL
jgi:hypothetical protein